MLLDQTPITLRLGCQCKQPIHSTRTIETRPSEKGKTIRRRRQCSLCQRRFTTREAVDEDKIRGEVAAFPGLSSSEIGCILDMAVEQNRNVESIARIFSATTLDVRTIVRVYHTRKFYEFITGIREQAGAEDFKAGCLVRLLKPVKEYRLNMGTLGQIVSLPTPTTCTAYMYNDDDTRKVVRPTADDPHLGWYQLIELVPA